MYKLSTYITIGEHRYGITHNGDFRMVLDCFKALQDEEISDTAKVLSALLIFYKDLKITNKVDDFFHGEVTEAINEMLKFFRCGEEDDDSHKHNDKLVDWEQDESIIMPAINNVAGKELRMEEYVHWYTFIGYYMSVGESVLSTVISIRYKEKHGKKLEKEDIEFKKNNPKYFRIKKTKEEQDFTAEILKNWSTK